MLLTDLWTKSAKILFSLFLETDSRFENVEPVDKVKKIETLKNA